MGCPSDLSDRVDFASGVAVGRGVGDPDALPDPLSRELDRLRRLGRWGPAIRLTRTRSAQPDTAPDIRLDCLGRLGQLIVERQHFAGGGSLSGALRVTHELQTVARRAESPEFLAEAAMLRAAARLEFSRGCQDPDKPLRLADECLLVAASYLGVSDTRRRGRLLMLQAMVHQLRGQHPTSQSWNDAALSLALTARDDLTASYALRHQGLALLVLRSEPRRALPLLSRSLSLRRSGGWMPWQAAGLLAVAQVHLELGYEVAGLLDEAEGLAREYGATRYIEHIAQLRRRAAPGRRRGTPVG